MSKKRYCLRDSNWKVTRDSPCVVWHTFLLHRIQSQKDALDLTLPVPTSPRAGNPRTGGLEPPFVHINPQIPTRFARCQFSCQPGPNTKAASLLSKMWCQNQVTIRYLDDKTEHLFCAMIGLLQGLFHLVSF